MSLEEIFEIVMYKRLKPCEQIFDIAMYITEASVVSSASVFLIVSLKSLFRHTNTKNAFCMVKSKDNSPCNLSTI